MRRVDRPALGRRVIARMLLGSAWAATAGAQDVRPVAERGFTLTGLTGFSNPQVDNPEVMRASAFTAKSPQLSEFVEQRTLKSHATTRRSLWGVEATYGRRLDAGGAIRVGVAWIIRSSYGTASSSTFQQSKTYDVTDAGATSVHSSAESRSEFRIRNATMTMRVAYDPWRISLGESTVIGPWLGVGVGWSQSRASAISIASSAQLRIVTPLEVVDLKIPSEDVALPDHAHDALATDVAAGIGLAFRGTVSARIGFRRADLGGFQIVKREIPSRFRTQLTSNGETLLIEPVARTQPLRANELFVALQLFFRPMEWSPGY